MGKAADTQTPAARRLKVGIVCYPTYGGSGAVATELANALACHGHTVHLFSFALPFRLQNLKCDNLMFHHVQPPEYPLFKSYPPYLLSLASKVAEVSQEVKLDVIHTHYAVPFTLAAVIAADMSRNHRPKVVTTLHGTDVTLVGQDPAFFEIVRFSLEKSDAITAVSDYLKAETDKIFGSTVPIQRIYNFVDTDRFKREKPDPFLANFHEQGYKVITHVSNFRAVKRVCDTVRVYHRIRKDAKARLVFIGEGPELPLAKKLVRELGIESEVFFLGFQLDVRSYLAGSDVLLMPSEDESFCVAALEAMACGAPVVATRVGGLPEVVEHGVCGYLTPVGAVDEQAEWVRLLLTDEGLWAGQSEAARRIAESRFGLRAVLPEYEALYARLVG